MLIELLTQKKFDENSEVCMESLFMHRGGNNMKATLVRAEVYRFKHLFAIFHTS